MQKITFHLLYINCIPENLYVFFDKHNDVTGELRQNILKLNNSKTVGCCFSHNFNLSNERGICTVGFLKVQTERNSGSRMEERRKTQTSHKLVISLAIKVEFQLLRINENCISAKLKRVQCLSVRATHQVRSMLDIHRVVHREHVPKGPTVNAELCCDVRKSWRERICANDLNCGICHCACSQPK